MREYPVFKQLSNADFLQNLSLYQYDIWPEFEPDDLPVEDTIETQSERLSTQTSQALDVEDTRDALSTRQSSLRDGQGTPPLLQLAGWREDVAYDEHPPTFIHYSSEWKLTANSKRVARDTEPNLVLTPSAFWTLVRQKTGKASTQKFTAEQVVQS